MYRELAILSVFALVYSSVAGRVERTWVSGPIVFTAFGLLAGPEGLNLLSLAVDAEGVRTLAELTLALVLFTDAAGADLSVLRKTKRLPLRLLLVGLPLTLLLGFGVGVLIFDAIPVFEVALLATMLAPTDAALGKAVVTNREVPDPIRQGLNVESGLNDGICVPILLVLLALAVGGTGEQGPSMLALRLVSEAIGIGLITGVVLSGGALALLRLCHRRGWISDTWIQVPVVALALACFASAQALGGSGFIASFTGGLLFGARLDDQGRESLLRAAEGTGDAFSLLTWSVFGVAVVGQAVAYVSGPILLYAALSLTVVRMLPVFVSVVGLGVSTEGRLFIGWFGPRGLASIVFAVIVLNAHLPNGRFLSRVVVWTIILSILGHGLSANPWVRSYGERRRRSARGERAWG